MDGLRTQAYESFLSDQNFKDPRLPQHLPFITVSKHQSTTKFEQSSISSTDIVKEINLPIDSIGNKTVEASLWIAKVDREFDGTLGVSQRAFMDMYNAFNLDLYWLHMLRCATYGFYQSHHPLPPPLQGSLYSFYVHTVSYVILWSYNTHNSFTRAIIITKGCYGVKNRDATLYQFLKLLDRHKDLIDEPRFLAFLVGVDLIRRIDDTNSKELISIRKIEAGTGHSLWGFQEEENRMPNTEELAEMSKRLGDICSSLANIIRHVSIGKT